MAHNPDWYLDGMKQDGQSITRDWQLLNQKLIDGVTIKQMSNVPTGYGHLCEVYRSDWKLDSGGVDQVFFSVLEPGSISGWHAHGKTTDRLFVALGRMLIVLYDARQSSPTHGQVNQFRLGTVRPALTVVPPGVWHGVQNIGSAASLLINVVDHAYEYEQPDHYRLPLDTEEIPYRFALGREG
jgi:dTDP-4-dehydrorhamnose 3,5-epimerase